MRPESKADGGRYPTTYLRELVESTSSEAEIARLAEELGREVPECAQARL